MSTELLQRLTWQDVREEVNNLDPIFTKIVDDLNPSNEYAIYKLKCPWGQHLMKDGVLQLPNSSGQWMPITDSSIDSIVQGDLSYNSNMPVGLVVKKTIEVYLQTLSQVASFGIKPTGAFFGLWIGLNGTIHSNHVSKPSNVVSGSRSVLFLPKISDAASFKRVKKAFTLQSKVPSSTDEQWPALVEISRQKEFSEAWEAEVIYFSKKWLDSQDDSKWKLFKYHLLNFAWNETNSLRDQIIFDLVFSCALEQKNLNPNPYLTDTAKHIFMAAQNYCYHLTYQIAEDNMVIPLRGLQRVFAEVYGLKYQPTLLVPNDLRSVSGKSSFYSLEVPSLLSFSPRARKVSNKLDDLREIKHIMERVIDYLKEDTLKLDKTPLYQQLVNKVGFEFYHTDADIYNETTKTEELLKVDQSIMREMKRHPDKPFCTTSPFLRGCVRICNKDK